MVNLFIGSYKKSWVVIVIDINFYETSLENVIEKAFSEFKTFQEWVS